MSHGDRDATSARPALLRRAIKRAASHTAWSETVVVTRNGLLLVELTGPVVVRRLGRLAPKRASAWVARWPAPWSSSTVERDDYRRIAVAQLILPVEDDDNVREALRRIRELDGHRVELARDVKPVSHVELTRILGRDRRGA